jgi:FdhD protein
MTAITELESVPGVQPVRFVSVNGNSPRIVDGEVVDELLACISVNGEELAAVMCSPHDLDKLALGLLCNEGVISSMGDVRLVQLSRSGTCVDVWLHDTNYKRPQRAIITAGCGGGVTFDDLSQQHNPLESEMTATPDQVSSLMRQMHLGATLYHRARGIHTAALADQENILLQVEDLGRHNCLDRLKGVALADTMDTQDLILLSSGRISSEMINKARKMGTPIVCSRTSPTALSVALANAWNMTVVAYVRQNRMRIYGHLERILSA